MELEQQVVVSQPSGCQELKPRPLEEQPVVGISLQCESQDCVNKISLDQGWSQ